MSEYISKCCKEAGIDRYTVQNLRDTYMNFIHEYRVRNNYTDLEEATLTGHTSITTNRQNYLHQDRLKMIEQMHNVSVSDIDVNGSIMTDVPSELNKQEHTAANGLGYCSENNHCEAPFSCMRCRLKAFVITPNNIPAYEAKIRDLNIELQNATSEEDIEALDLKKSICVSILGRLIALGGNV